MNDDIERLSRQPAMTPREWLGWAGCCLVIGAIADQAGFATWQCALMGSVFGLGLWMLTRPPVQTSEAARDRAEEEM